MQMICKLSSNAESYVSENAHLQVKRPKACPHCSERGSLWILGIYRRWVTGEHSGKPCQLKIRRFQCHVCQGTVSMLPSFAQPYRLVCNATIERYFNGERLSPDIVRREFLLRRYWDRFESWFPRMLEIMGFMVAVRPPDSGEGGSWQIVSRAFGSMSQTTQKLVRQYEVTLFGKYRCHSPRPPPEA